MKPASVARARPRKTDSHHPALSRSLGGGIAYRRSLSLSRRPIPMRVTHTHGRRAGIGARTSAAMDYLDEMNQRFVLDILGGI